MSEFTDTLRRLLDDAGITYTSETIAQSEAYFRLVEAANRQTNLTRITDEAQAAAMHFFGAMQLLQYCDLPHGCRVIDIGTGAGFPGIPLKIARPDIDLTLLDSAGKKTAFVQNATEQLHLNVTVLNERAEETARTRLRESFDAAVSRAVASLPMLAELCLPFVKTGGVFAAWKGEKHGEELHAAHNALRTLGGQVQDVYPTGQGAIVLIAKKKPAPDAYPRRFSKIKNQPL